MCIFIDMYIKNIIYMYYFDTNNNFKIRHCPYFQVDHNFITISETSLFTAF